MRKNAQQHHPRPAAPPPPVARAGSLLCRYHRDRRGAVALLAAVLFPIVIGGIGLGVETSFWYMTKRMLQHAADVSAHAAGVRNRAGDSIADIRVAATHTALSSGFAAQLGSITVNKPPTAGAFVGDPESVEVRIVENRPRWFTALFSAAPVVIPARAVTRISGGAIACILALSPTADGAFTVAGSTSVNLNNCDVASNSLSPTAFLMSGGSAAMTTGCGYAVGQASVTAGLTLTKCQNIKVNAPVVRDPYRDVAEPAAFGTCQNRNVGQPTQATTVTATENHPSGVKSRRYCSGLDLKGQVTFSPGLYIIEGGTFSINGGDQNATSAASISGQGVTFYLGAGARLVLNGNVSLNLSAPTSGPFSGLLFFGARNATGLTHTINGTSGSTLQGAVYMPAAAIDFKGDSKVTNGCTQVIGLRVTMTGNSSLSSSCADAGTKTILANENVRLVE